MPGVPLLHVLQETSRLLKINVDDTDDDDNGADGDENDDGDDDDDDGDDGYDDDGDLLAPGHQEGSSGSRPSPPRPTPEPSGL